MKYETPEMTALMPAIYAIQYSDGGLPKSHRGQEDLLDPYESVNAYTDWE
jgi:hypothetical protein